MHLSTFAPRWGAGRTTPGEFDIFWNENVKFSSPGIFPWNCPQTFVIGAFTKVLYCQTDSPPREQASLSIPFGMLLCVWSLIRYIDCCRIWDICGTWILDNQERDPNYSPPAGSAALCAICNTYLVGFLCTLLFTRWFLLWSSICYHAKDKKNLFWKSMHLKWK